MVFNSLTFVAFFALVYGATLACDLIFLGVPAVDWEIAATLVPLTWLGGFTGLRIADRLNEMAAAILSILVLALAGLYTLAAAAHAALH